MTQPCFQRLNADEGKFSRYSATCNLTDLAKAREMYSIPVRMVAGAFPI